MSKSIFQMRVQKHTVVFVKNKHKSTIKSLFKLDYTIGYIFRLRSLVDTGWFHWAEELHVNTDKVAL